MYLLCKIKLVGQDIQNLEPEQDRQAHRQITTGIFSLTENVTMSHS